MKAIYLLPENNLPLIYGPDEQREIAAQVELVAPRLDALTYPIWRGRLDDVEAIFSGWGMAKMDETFFEVFPNLKILFYGAGAVSGFVTEQVWERGVQIANANVANGVSVAEYTAAQVLLCLKQNLATRRAGENNYAVFKSGSPTCGRRVWQQRRNHFAGSDWPHGSEAPEIPGRKTHRL